MMCVRVGMHVHASTLDHVHMCTAFTVRMLVHLCNCQSGCMWACVAMSVLINSRSVEVVRRNQDGREGVEISSVKNQEPEYELSF